MMRCSVKPSSHARCSRHAPCAVGRGASSLRAITCIAALCLAAVFGSSELHAHDGPEHVIERINAEIEQSGPTQWLLYSRAMEYRAVREVRPRRGRSGGRRSTRARRLVRSVAVDPSARQVGQACRGDPSVRSCPRDLPKNANSGIHADVLALNGHIYAELCGSDAAELFRQSVAMCPDVNYILMRSRALTHLPERRRAASKSAK